jgi:hypothetical protein
MILQIQLELQGFHSNPGDAFALDEPRKKEVFLKHMANPASSTSFTVTHLRSRSKVYDAGESRGGRVPVSLPGTLAHCQRFLILRFSEGAAADQAYRTPYHPHEFTFSPSTLSSSTLSPLLHNLDCQVQFHDLTPKHLRRMKWLFAILGRLLLMQ